MNALFKKCPNLNGQQVPHFLLLSCIHVHERGQEDKDFTIYCDNSFNSMEYAGEERVTKSPRFSSILYVTDNADAEVCEGQVVAIISYKPLRSERRVYLLINRFRQVNEVELKKRFIPQRLLQYNSTGQSIYPDCIPISNVKAPLFVVPALDKGVDIHTFGNVENRKAFYYVISQAKVKCSSILGYDNYLAKNNTFFSHRNANKSFQYLNFNPFLTIQDMLHIKEMINVQRDIPTYDNSAVEAFDFEFDLDDEDANVINSES